jgi:hemolysin D
MKARGDGRGGWLADLARLWRDRGRLADRNLSADLRAFLPPSLEIMERPPHPAAGWLLRVLAAIVAAALAWGVLGKVDVISVAEGKIIPSGKVKEIQPLSGGVVAAIAVAEGQRVEEGQVLVELDPTQTRADEARLLAETATAKARRDRRLALVGLLRLPPDEPIPDEAVVGHPSLGGDRGNGLTLLEEYRAILFQRQGLESQIRERRHELAGSQVLVRQYMANEPLALKRLEALASLHEGNMVGLTELVSAQAYHNEQVFGLDAENQRSEQLRAAIVSAERQLGAQVAQSLAGAIDELDELERQLGAIGQELLKARDLSEKQTLRSPVGGTVKGLAANTVGGVVSPAQVLMEIVPRGETLEVEAFLGNQDIGHVKAGQKAEIKVATYPFTRYGVINAEVSHVAEDATVDETLGLVYRLRLALEKDHIMVDGREEPLMPGMAVTAEIATDKRRVIEFVLAPLLRMKDESLRER